MKFGLGFLVLSLFSIQLAHAAPFAYRCYGVGQDKGARMTLSLTKKHLSTVEFGVGKLNPKYKPTDANKNMVQFNQFELFTTHSILVEEVMLTGGKKMSSGSPGGMVKVRSQEGEFEQTVFACFRFSPQPFKR